MTRGRLAAAALLVAAAAGGAVWWWTRPPATPPVIVFEVTGPVDAAMAKRAAAVFESGSAPVLLVFDTPDGEKTAVRSMGEALTEAQGRGRRIAGYVRKQAKGAGGSLALACVPLYCHPESELGGGRPFGGGKPNLPEAEIKRAIEGRAVSWATIAGNRGRDAYQASVLVTLHVVLDGQAAVDHRLADGTAPDVAAVQQLIASRGRAR